MQKGGIFVGLAAAWSIGCGGHGRAHDASVQDGAETAIDASDPGIDAELVGPERPIVILMIGDGMGPGQLEAASLYAHGEPGRLFLETLPVRGELATASLSGITDSAAAATTMATGERTYNGRVGLDRFGQPVETLIELAHRLGLGAGIVTTSSLPHATPAGFSAHRGSRGSYVDIADDQALVVKPDVMLGGGSMFYLPRGAGSVRDDLGLVAPLVADGYVVVTSAAELDALPAPANGDRVVGLFAPEHLDYVIDRPADSTQPTLAEMSLAALRWVAAYEGGFFLLIEGARIDMASHSNDLARTIAETLAFDEAVREVATWAENRDNVTILVTADHECGGLDVVTPRGAGVLPDVTWRWLQHTNARVGIYGQGPGSEVFDGTVRDHVAVHETAAARLARRAPVLDGGGIVPDGRLGDLRHVAAVQTAETSFGVGYNQLDALRVDADSFGLGVGVEGVFEWTRNAVVLLIDVDYGLGTGYAAMRGALTDRTGRVDSILASLPFDAPPVSDGFGVDYAIVAWGGQDPKREDLIDDAGLRGVHPPHGHSYDLFWYGVATNFGEGVRVAGAPGAGVSGEGWEIHLAWRALFPALDGRVPPGMVVAIAVVLVNDDGGYASNQALPPFPSGTPSPGRDPVALPGIITFELDPDGDGVPSGDAVPIVVR